jgi:hypothetical protein
MPVRQINQVTRGVPDATFPIGEKAHDPGTASRTTDDDYAIQDTRNGCRGNASTPRDPVQTWTGLFCIHLDALSERICKVVDSFIT